MSNDQQEWEEIDPQEVELIVSTLDGLMENLKTETLVAHLQETVGQIESLADWDDEETADAA